MFTGIIEAMGAVTAATPKEGGLLVGVRVPFKAQPGESIALNGVCTTVAGLFKEGFTCFLSPETLARTTAGGWRAGTNLHVERALSPTGRLGGHFVTGHVDGVGRVASVQRQGETVALKVQVPAGLARWLIEKGSVALDGVSLTVNEAAGGTLGVTVIPFTLQMTHLGRLREGDAVNVEADLVAKTVAATVERLFPGAGAAAQEKAGGITVEDLDRLGFTRR